MAHALRDRRVLEALFVVPDRVFVVADEVVEEREAEERPGVRRVEFDGAFEALGRAGAVAVGFGEAAFLEVEFGIVGRHRGPEQAVDEPAARPEQ